MVNSLETPTPTADIAALLVIIFIFRVLCLVVALVRSRSPSLTESREISRRRSFVQARMSMMVTDVGGLASSRRRTIVDEQGRRQTRYSFAHGASASSRRRTIVDEQGRRQTRRSFAHGASVKRGAFNTASVKWAPFNANVEEVEPDGPRDEAAAGSGPGQVSVSTIARSESGSALPVKGATSSTV